MKKKCIFIFIASVFTILILSGRANATTVKTEVNGTYDYDLAIEVVEKTNKVRQENGLSKLQFNRDIEDVAMLRAAESYISFSHTRPDGTWFYILNDYLNGENIAAGQKNSQEVIDAWMNSPSHRENILRSEFKSFSVGVFEKDGIYYWCQNFSCYPSNNTSTSGISGKVQVTKEINLDTGLINNIECNLDNLNSYEFEKDTIKDIKITVIDLGGYEIAKAPIDSKQATYIIENENICEVIDGKLKIVGNGTTSLTIKIGNAEKKYTITGKKVTENTQTSSMPFIDVNKTDWYYGDVKYVYENKLITGYNDGKTFGPNDKITRAMIVTILYRMEGNPSVTGKSGFSDVADNVWYSKAIKWATDKGIVHGYNSDKFGPNDNVIKQDLMVILRNYAKYKKKDTNVSFDLSSYSDRNKIASYAKTAIEWAVKNEILKGGNGKLNPQGAASRAETAAYIHRYCTKIGR